LEAADRRRYYNVMLKLLAENKGPLSHRAVADMVQTAQRVFNRSISRVRPVLGSRS
jgi:hypothetical protein